jgi:hypothetical protein
MNGNAIGSRKFPNIGKLAFAKVIDRPLFERFWAPTSAFAVLSCRDTCDATVHAFGVGK